MVGKTSDNYDSGRRLAEKSFNYSFETGRTGVGGSECQFYIEAVALAIRDGYPMTPLRISLIQGVKDDINTRFSDGICDFLLKKMGSAKK